MHRLCNRCGLVTLRLIVYVELGKQFFLKNLTKIFFSNKNVYFVHA